MKKVLFALAVCAGALYVAQGAAARHDVPELALCLVVSVASFMYVWRRVWHRILGS